MGKAKTTGPTRYLITGGGTAGHVYPGLALAEGIRRAEPNAEFLFVGAERGVEKRLVPNSGYRLKTLPVLGLPPGRSPLAWARTLWLLGRSVLTSLGLLVSFRPHVVIGTGGYASAPVLLAALLLRALQVRKKTILCLHEANIIPGRLNRWMSRWTDFTGTSFPETLRYLPPERALWTGYPLRESLERVAGQAERCRRSARREHGIPEDARVLLIFGGSSGAQAINRAVLRALPSLLARQDLYIFHATGYPSGTYDPVAEFREILPSLEKAGQGWKDRYLPTPYLEHIEHYYGMADLVISRSGAGTVWEIALYGVPAILIPKSRLPADHQVKNAYFLARKGQARILLEAIPVPPEPGGRAEVDADELLQLVFSILDDPDRYQEMKGAARREGLPAGAHRFYEAIQAARAGEGQRRGSAPSGTAVAGRSRPPPEGVRTRIEWLGTLELLAYAEDNWNRRLELPHTERAYLEYKTDELLCSSRWQDRNVGVKLVGLIGYRERLPALLRAITDRTPAAWYWRLLGGDFEQVGFIRRNALQAVWRLGIYDERVRDALRKALDDPYYEVRSWAARAIERLSDQIGQDTELEGALRRNLKDRSFEVVVYSLQALCRITKDRGVLSDLVPLLAHKNWKVQQATVRCLMQLIEANVIHLPREAEAWMRKIPMKGLDFSPRFPLKQTWDEFQRLLSRRNPPEAWARGEKEAR